MSPAVVRAGDNLVEAAAGGLLATGALEVTADLGEEIDRDFVLFAESVGAAAFGVSDVATRDGVERGDTVRCGGVSVPATRVFVDGFRDGPDSRADSGAAGDPGAGLSAGVLTPDETRALEVVDAGLRGIVLRAVVGSVPDFRATGAPSEPGRSAGSDCISQPYQWQLAPRAGNPYCVTKTPQPSQLLPKNALWPVESA